MDGLGEMRIVDWLGDVHIAPQRIAARNVPRLIDCGETDDWDVFRPLISLQALEDLKTIEYWQIQIEEDQQRHGMLDTLVKEIIDCCLAIRQGDDLIDDERPAQIAFDQPGMPRVVFHEEYGDGLGVRHLSPLGGAYAQW